MLVAQRRGAKQEPAIFAVSPLKAHFILGRLPSGHVRAPLFYSPWEVLGMNRARWVFKFLLERNARIFQPTLIDEINGAVGPKAPGYGRNCVNDESHTRSSRAFGAPAVSPLAVLSLRCLMRYLRQVQCQYRT